MNAVVAGNAAQIRPLLAADLDAVMAIEQRAYAYPWTRRIFSDCLRVGYCCWCYAAGAEIRGYGVMSVAAGESHLLNLTVSPAAQRQGVGTRLLKHFMQLACRHNADIVLLEVRPSNKPALALYEKLGFNEIGVRRDYYPAAQGREDALLLARSLVD